MGRVSLARLCALAALSAVLEFVAVASAAAPIQERAPGRVVFSVNGGVVSNDLDGGGAVAGVALPDDGAILIGQRASGRGSGFYAARMSALGTLDRSFGNGGIARVGAPPFRGGQIVRQPDGKLVVVGGGVTTNRFQGPQFALVRLNPDGSRDQSFGSGGVAQLPIQYSCVCTNLALLPSGEFIVTGNTGQFAHSPNAVPDTRWVVARLTSTGALDPGFGQSGIATLPENGALGYDASVLPNGDIVALGSEVSGGRYLTRLLPSGALDPAFNGGVPASLPADAGYQLVANPDGSVVIDLQVGLLRYTTAGVPDPTFGAGGGAQVESAGGYQLLPAAAGGVVVVITGGVGTQLQVVRIAANGAVDPTLGGPKGLRVDTRFGGGGSSNLGGRGLLPPPPLMQNSFRSGSVVARPDGSYLVVGGVSVSQPTAAGTGRSIFDFAVVALTPSFAPDTTFGAAVTRLHARLRVLTQTVNAASGGHGIRVRLNVSAPGLCRVVIKARGRVIAQSVLPVFAPGSATRLVELTGYGGRWLRGHHRVNLRASVRASDLVTNTAIGTASGALR